MAVANIISLGIGSPASIEHFITFGLEAGVDVLLTGGETGYDYATLTVTAPSLIAVPPSAEPSLVATVPAAEPSLVATVPAAEPSLVATVPSSEPVYDYNP